jgi:hypothetical protein
MKKGRLFFLSFLILIPLYGIYPQSSSGGAPPPAGPEMPEFPQWSKDLRRAEIIAFGSFPFTMLTATTIIDSIRWKNNGWDTRYAPWPIKSAGAVSMTNRERETTLAIAGAASVTVAAADYIIISIKRHKARQRALAIPVGTPIIIKKPFPDSGETIPELDDETVF